MKDFSALKSTIFIASTRWNSDIAIARQFQTLAECLAERGHRVVVLVPPRRNNDYAQSDLLRIAVWPSPRPTRFADAWFLFWLIRKFRPNTLIGNFGADNWMMVIGWLLRVHARVTWYHTVYDAAISGHFRHPIVKQFLKKRKTLVYKLATNIVAVSNAAAKDARQVFQIPQRNIHVIHNLIPDPLTSTKCETTIVPTKIACVGGLEDFKGHDVLIRAIALLKPRLPGLRLLLIGNGSQMEALTTLAASLDVESNVVFCGNLPRVQVMEELSSSFLAVHPSRAEAFGLAVIEALAVGTPVIASAVGGIPEIIRDDYNGFLVPPDDPEALARSIEHVFKTPGLHQHLSEYARKSFLENFELTSNIGKIASWVEALNE